MKNDQLILSHFTEQHPGDVAEILAKLEATEAALFLNDLPGLLVLGVIQALDLDYAADCLEEMRDEKASEIITLLSRQRAAVLLRQMKPASRNAILENLPKRTAHPLVKILSFSENSAGALADSVVLSLPEKMSVKLARERLKSSLERSIYYVYIVDDDFKLTGVLDLRELLRAQADRLLVDIMQRNFITIPAEQTIKPMLAHPGWQSFHVLPVTTSEGTLLGAITFAMLRLAETSQQSLQPLGSAEMAINALGNLYQIGLMSMLPIRRKP